jgi:hypothetical protein
MADGFDLLVPSPEVCMTFSCPTTPTGTESPCSYFQDSAVCPRLPEEGCAVGRRLSAEAPHDCADAQREVEILHAGREIEEHMRQYAETGDFAARGAADRARLRMEELIRGRSPEVVARLEQERGLR